MCIQFHPAGIRSGAQVCVLGTASIFIFQLFYYYLFVQIYAIFSGVSNGFSDDKYNQMHQCHSNKLLEVGGDFDQ